MGNKTAEGGFLIFDMPSRSIGQQILIIVSDRLDASPPQLASSQLVEPALPPRQYAVFDFVFSQGIGVETQPSQLVDRGSGQGS